MRQLANPDSPGTIAYKMLWVSWQIASHGTSHVVSLSVHHTCILHQTAKDIIVLFLSHHSSFFWAQDPLHNSEGGTPSQGYWVNVKPYSHTYSCHVLVSEKITKKTFKCKHYGCTCNCSWVCPTNYVLNISESTLHSSLYVVRRAPFYASVLRPASQAGPMHESAGVGEVS